MRESGFDPSNRYGPFSADITSYVPVCLNSLLCQMEEDLAEASRRAADEEAAKRWEARAEERRARMDRFLWDEAEGLYLDYNFETRKRRIYPFAATFYPLWAGAASRAQAEKYDVRRGASDVAADIRFGYAANQVGFGWTNGVYLELLAGLETARSVVPRPRGARDRAPAKAAYARPVAAALSAR